MFKPIQSFLRLKQVVPTLLDQQKQLLNNETAQAEQLFHTVASLHAQDLELNKQTEQLFHTAASLHAQDLELNKQTEQLFHLGALIETQNIELNKQTEQLFHIGALLEAQHVELNRQTEQLFHISALIEAQGLELASRLKSMEERLNQDFTANQLAMLNPRLRRNFLPNDDAAAYKYLMAIWRTGSASTIGYKDLLESGFRVFSQNDEDGMLLRIFSHIGQTNQYVIEIGSNCSGSDLGIPENLSTNLIVNHGWHGAIFEIDPTECDRMRYFFARDYATKHFHVTNNGQHGYFSPLIVQSAISPENIDQLLRDTHDEPEPDLMVIDIDGGDYAVMRSMSAVRPRVLVVEFEKRFRDRHSVVQFDSTEFSKRWPQSGSSSLPAWEKLLTSQGYTLCAIGTCGFNAFFIRSDIAAGKFLPLTSSEAFDRHPILSKVSEEFWLIPDETWQSV